MASDSYSFLDIVALPGVRARFARGDALLLLSAGLDEVLWANGPGAALFGYAEIDRLLDAPVPIGNTARRQIAATRGFPQIGTDRAVAVRLQSGMNSRVVPFQASALALPDGATGILLSVGAGKVSEAEAAAGALAGIAQPGQAAAIVGAEGQVLAASDGFASFGLEPDLLRLLVDKAAETDRPLKQKVRSGDQVLPAGVAPLGSGASLVVVTEGDFFDLPDDVLSAADAEINETDPGESVTFLPLGDATVEGAETPVDADDADDWYFNAEEEAANGAEARLAAIRATEPVRFSWRTRADGRLVSVSPEFTGFAGLGFDALNGQSFEQVARRFGVTGGEEIAALLQGRDTWSGRTVLWPLGEGAVAVPVDLAALPTYSRARAFEGFRGFGVVRTGDAAFTPAPPDHVQEVASGEEGGVAPNEAGAPEARQGSLKDDGDRVVHLLSAARAVSSETALSPDEHDAFREIGARLKGDESAASEPEGLEADAGPHADPTAQAVPGEALSPMPDARALAPAGLDAPKREDAEAPAPTAESVGQPEDQSGAEAEPSFLSAGEAASAAELPLWNGEPALRPESSLESEAEPIASDGEVSATERHGSEADLAASEPETKSFEASSVPANAEEPPADGDAALPQGAQPSGADSESLDGERSGLDGSETQPDATSPLDEGEAAPTEGDFAEDAGLPLAGQAALFDAPLAASAEPMALTEATAWQGSGTAGDGEPGLEPPASGGSLEAAAEGDQTGERSFPSDDPDNGEAASLFPAEEASVGAPAGLSPAGGDPGRTPGSREQGSEADPDAPPAHGATDAGGADAGAASPAPSDADAPEPGLAPEQAAPAAPEEDAWTQTEAAPSGTEELQTEASATASEADDEATLEAEHAPGEGDGTDAEPATRDAAGPDLSLAGTEASSAAVEFGGDGGRSEQAAPPEKATHLPRSEGAQTVATPAGGRTEDVPPDASGATDGFVADEAEPAALAGVPHADTATGGSAAEDEAIGSGPAPSDGVESRADGNASGEAPARSDPAAPEQREPAEAFAAAASLGGGVDAAESETGEAAQRSGQPDTSILDRLPIPVLIHSGDLLHYANPEFLSLARYPSLAAFAEAGGLGCLFTAPWERISEGSDRSLRLRTSGGEEFPVEALLRTAPWRGNKALLLVLRRLDAALPRDGEETAELGQRLSEMRAIIDTATDGVVLIAPDGTIRSISRPAEALFGLDGEAAAGQPFGALFSAESRPAVAAYLDGLAGDGVASVLNDGREVIGREAKGGFIPLFMTIGRLPERSGFCAVLRDITPWKRAEEELTQSRALAERASSHKTDFLARVSHEIRTPLNAIIGFSELMLDEKFGPVGSDRYRDYLRDINRSGSHVLDLVNDLLDISKIEAGQQEMSYEAVALNDALGEAVSTMQPQANRERVIIRSSFASRLPDVVADPRSVRQIALNVLSNAIRFTQAGGQVIVSTAYDSSGDVVLRVRDTGIGMSQAEIEQALKPFKQINSLKRTRGDGTGLGLPLTKAMVEANRARFAISSSPGDGTMVEVTFPATRVLAG